MPNSSSQVLVGLRARQLFTLAILFLFLSGCDIPRNYDAAMLLADIAAGTDPDQVETAAADARRETVTFTVEGRTYAADLYLPKEPVRAGVVMVPGAAEKGRNDPRLVAFAEAFSRAELAVLVPDLPSLRELEVHSGNIREIAGALRYLARHEEFTPGRRTGLIAFSYAAGPAVLAAREAAGAPPLDVVLTIGGYHSLPAVLTFMTTGDYRVDSAWRHMQPNPYGQWVFVKSNLRHLDDPADRNLFRRMITRKKADLDASLTDLAGQLGPQGRDLYRFVTNRDRSRVEALYAKLPAAVRAEVDRLDLASKSLDDLEARLILVHGYDDTIIPYTQSVALAEALPYGQAELYLVDGLMHVDASPGWVGRWRMWRALAAFLAVRDAEEDD